MNFSKNKIGIKFLKGFLFLFLLMFWAPAMIFAINLTVMDSRAGGGQVAITIALRDIYTGTDTYRLAEMEYVLSSEQGEKDKYEKRMESVLRQIATDQQELEKLLSSQLERAAYEKFNAGWNAYLKESKNTIALSQKNLNRSAVEALSKKTRVLFEQSNQSLNILIETNLKYANSWAGFIKELFRKNRLAFLFFYVVGVAGFFVFIFNFYYKIKEILKA